MKSTGGIGGLIENFISVMHVPRMRRGAPKPLETLQYGCWKLGSQAGVKVHERRDFQIVLYRWARRPGDREPGDELPEPDELAQAVVQRLRPSRFWKLVLGFVPIVGPIAACRLDAALALRFHDLATEYFRDLKSAGVRPCQKTLRSLRHRGRTETGRRTAPLIPCDERLSAFSPSIAPRSTCTVSAAWRESERRRDRPGGWPDLPGCSPT